MRARRHRGIVNKEDLMRTSRLIGCLSLALCGSALAQSATGVGGAPSSPSNAKHLQGAEMNATLAHSVDVRKAKPGDAVTATLVQDVRANGRLLLLRGTMLVGRVTEAQTRARHSDPGGARTDSRLGIVFESAVLGDGRAVPVHATVQAVAAADAAASSPRGADDGAARSSLTSGSRGVFGLAGVEIEAAAATDGRAPLLISSSGNIALKSGTQLLLVASNDATAAATTPDAQIGDAAGNDGSAATRSASASADARNDSAAPL
jgi:hypothetical protein